jgi:hypothetical protein
MADIIQRLGVIKHPKPKDESDFPNRQKILPEIFDPLRFLKRYHIIQIKLAI